MSMMVCQSYKGTQVVYGTWRRPSTATFSGTASYSSHSNDALAYDTGTTESLDVSTYGYLQASGRPRTDLGTSIATMIYTGFSGSVGDWYVKVSMNGTTEYQTSLDESTSVGSGIHVDYCTDWNGSTGSWVQLTYLVNGSVIDTSTPLISAFLSSVNPATIAVRVQCDGIGDGGTISSHAQADASASIYDVAISPTFY